MHVGEYGVGVSCAFGTPDRREFGTKTAACRFSTLPTVVRSNEVILARSDGSSLGAPATVGGAGESVGEGS